jgi:carboxyl-terminal processing protease
MSRTVRIGLAVVIGLVLLAGAFSGGILIGWLIPDNVLARSSSDSGIVVSDDSTVIPSDPISREQLFAPFWEAWDIVHAEFVEQPVDDVALMRGAISGMLEALGDKHTSYMDPEQFKTSQRSLDGEYQGIGAWVDITGEYLVIISPMPASPAEKAGVKANDTIIAVDGNDMTGVDGQLVLQRILGPANTDVTLTIRREGLQEPIDITITRAKIVVPSVTSEMKENDIAYIQLSTYGDKTTDELKKALKELIGQNPKGLILDLRNNGGGYLGTAIEVVSQFIPKGVVMYEVYGNGDRDTFEALPGGLATEIPLVILVNEGTASASEITAGAIQDLGRGKLVGVTTYGKGSVQRIIPLKDEKGVVRVTIARWVTPNERQINEVGLTPDVVVEITEEDIAAERDPQLEKAIELLTSGGAQ